MAFSVPRIVADSKEANFLGAVVIADKLL